jgi:hypothetical protein
MLLLWGLLMLFVWMAVAQGLPPLVEQYNKGGDWPTPPLWSLALAALAIYFIDLGYRNLLPQTRSHEALQELVLLMSNRDHRAVLDKLERYVDEPPWEQGEPIESEREPGPF